MVGQRVDMGSVTLQMTLEFHFKEQRVGVDRADKVKMCFAQEEGTYEKS